MVTIYDFRRGDLLADKYRIERVLGEGGMGIVFEATQIDLDRRVAVKLLTWGDNDDVTGQARARFEREARIAAKLQSVHAAKVLDVGKLPDGKPFMVMEYLDGEDLNAYCERLGRLDVAQAVDFVLQACEAMAEAHAMGIIHRDLKPANLFLTRHPDGKPLVKVLDFGISKVIAEASASLTHTGGVIGTPQYMSPEQLSSSKHVSPPSDIWSLGTILYELITGNAAFGGDSVAVVHANVLKEHPAPPRSVRADVSPGLDAVIMRCLKKEIARRPQTMADLAEALAPFGSSQGVASAAAAVRIWAAAPANAGTARTVAVPLVRRAETPDLEVSVATAVDGVRPAGTLQSVSRASEPDGPTRGTRALVAGIGLLALGAGLALYRSAHGGGAQVSEARSVTTAAAATVEPVSSAVGATTAPALNGTTDPVAPASSAAKPAVTPMLSSAPSVAHGSRPRAKIPQAAATAKVSPVPAAMKAPDSEQDMLLHRK
jgi:predicted Ser/Thr protein kinase